MIAHWLRRRIFARTMNWDTKIFVVALNECTNSTSSFTLPIVDSGNCWKSPTAPSSRPPWSHLYTTEGLHARIPQSRLLVRNVKTIPVYFWIRSSYNNTNNTIITLITLHVYNNIIIILQLKKQFKNQRKKKDTVRWQLINRPWFVAWVDGDGSKGEV